ncbi:MAG: hypothetical protein M3Q76_01730, partial [Acidobacteriota bacterium]|nr:hypothetical protein [Acidobacteriota bacterium]
TDSAGQYNIPSVGEGAFVISLDPVTVPDGYLLAGEGRRPGRSWTRLLRTPLGGGALLRQNFALIPPAEGRERGRGGDGEKGRRGEGETGRRDAAALTLGSNDVTGKRNEATDASLLAASLPLPNTVSSPASLSPPLPLSRVGTYETAAPDYVEPIAPGEVVVAQPAAEEVIMSPALSVEARVAEGWAVALEVNGERVNDSHIGERRLDHKNKVSTFTFVGLNLRPGPNRLKATAMSKEGVAARSVEQMVYGRGPARRLEIVPAKREVQAGGRDATLVTVRAFDQWGHPAADGQIAVQTSAGRLLVPNANKAKNGEVNSSLQGEGTNAIAAISAEQINQNSQQQMAQLAGGETVVELISDGAPATAKLHASAGEVEAEEEVRIIPEVRPALLVGLAEISIGRAAPEISMRGEEGNFRSRLAFYYRGQFFGQNLLTLAYDSQRPLNRTAAGRDRLFQLDPLERVYPLFGDSSTRFEDAQSNSKLYARLDRGRSYAMFGDFDADLQTAGLATYARNLTGVKLHAENANGDFVTVTGARPDTAFARDVLPGGFLSLQRLSHFDILPGSETVTLEVRDRRNPEIILSRQTLARSVDYNLNPASGEIFFLRPISVFDYELNLLQTVVTYEYRASDLSSAVYTARAQKRFGQTLQLGLSFVDQRQADLGSFLLGGVDGEWTLPRRGKLQFAWAMSRGRVAANGNVFNTIGDGEHNGQAYRVELEQPLPLYDSVLRANFSRSDEDFLNPFGQTSTPGAQRAGVSLDLRPRSSRVIRFQLLDERNRTANVDNERITAGLSWNETWTDRLRTFFAYDFRRLNDELSERDTTSNLITAGVEYRPTDKLELSVKREQNLGESDPTYPNQTTLSARYQFNQQARLFFTQRLASAPIVPIADVANTGFAATGSRRETAIGVETQFGRYTSMTGRYQLENGINGTDSFAVIGLQNRLPLSKVFSLDLQYERGFHLAGQGESFNTGGIGLSWQPTANFRSSARYELRDRNGLGQLLTIGAAGKMGDGVTALAQVQMGRAVFGERGSSSFNGTAAISFRPLDSDRAALLFSYTRRSLAQDATTGRAPTRDRSDTLSSDGLYQLTKDLELYGRFALRLSANGDQTLAFASALTYLGQGRAQYRLSRRFDLAGEVRMLAQPASHTRRFSSGAELGYWALSDLRFGGGYNFTSAVEPHGLP